MTRITLLAPRPRVEERLLQRAFAERGHEASLLDPECLAISLIGNTLALPRVVVDRGPATLERATVGALLAASGGIVVNRAATTRLLADRIALVRHLVIAGIPVPETEIAFGEDAALQAIERVGYPAYLLSPCLDPRLPDVIVGDRDAAEAVVEHRAVLAHEKMLLVQQYIDGETMRLPVVGSAVLTAEIVQYETNRTMRYESFGGQSDGLIELAKRVSARLGSGVYEVQIVQGADGPVVGKVHNLVDFRSMVDTGVDVVGMIVDFVVGQLSGDMEA